MTGRRDGSVPWPAPPSHNIFGRMWTERRIFPAKSGKVLIGSIVEYVLSAREVANQLSKSRCRLSGNISCGIRVGASPMHHQHQHVHFAEWKPT